MTQYARPDADTDIGDWNNNNEDEADLFDYVNATGSGDDTYIYVADYGSGSPITFRLSDVDEPDSGTRTVVVRAYEDGGMGSVSLTVTLKEGATSKGSQTFSSGFASGAANLSFNITSSISDYSNLNLTISTTDMSGMATTYIYQAYFSVPDAASAAGTSEAFLLFVD